MTDFNIELYQQQPNLITKKARISEPFFVAFIYFAKSSTFVCKSAAILASILEASSTFLALTET